MNENERNREEEYQSIKKKYSKMSEEELSELKNTHTNEIEFLFKEIAQTRASIETYNSKLDLKDHEIATIKDSYERELASNMSEINTLNKKIIQIE